VVSKSRRVDGGRIAPVSAILGKSSRERERERERGKGKEAKERRESSIFDRDLKLYVRYDLREAII